MEKIKFFGSLVLMALLCFSFTSCSDDDPAPQTNDTLTITPSKPSIIADGEDQSKFTVSLGSVDVTPQAKILINGTDELSTVYFSTTAPGKYTFVAKYEGKESEPTTVTATEPERPVTIEGDFIPQSVIHQMTSTNCVFCPFMNTFLKYELQPKYPDELTVITMHDNFTRTDPMHIAETKQYQQEYGFSGYPSAMINMRIFVAGTKEEMIEQEVVRFLGEIPQGGVRIAHSEVTGKKVSGTVKFYPKVSQDYRLNIYLLEDALQYPDSPQSGIEDDYAAENYVHDNVVLSVYPNTNGLRLNNAVAEEEMTVPFEFSLPLIKQQLNCRLVAVVRHFEQGIEQEYKDEPVVNDFWVVTNATECQLGSSSQYKIKE